jgi:hypothetical protein
MFGDQLGRLSLRIEDLASLGLLIYGRNPDTLALRTGHRDDVACFEGFDISAISVCDFSSYSARMSGVRNSSGKAATALRIAFTRSIISNDSRGVNTGRAKRSLRCVSVSSFSASKDTWEWRARQR